MKIIVKRNEQTAEITFDLQGVNYPYAIRDAIASALEFEGFTKETILEVFNKMPVEKVCPTEDEVTKPPLGLMPLWLHNENRLSWK